MEALTQEGLVEEVGEGESTGGRPPTLLKLRTKEAIAVGVAITPTCTRETIEVSIRRGLASTQIMPSTLGEKPELRGALSLVLASKFAAASAAWLNYLTSHQVGSPL